MQTVNDDVWESAPRKLSAEEMENPEKVIEEFYDYARLPQVRAYLWGSFKAMISGGYPRLKYREKYNLIYFYEQIERLVEATHILHARRNFN